MDTKIVPYGTTLKCRVDYAGPKWMIVIGEDDEAYLLIGHGLTRTPKFKETGTITFTRHDGPTKGDWKFVSDVKEKDLPPPVKKRRKKL